MLHLFHPALVHFTIAFLLTGAAFELAGLVRRNESIERLGTSLQRLGAVSLVPTIVSGYLAVNTVDLTARAEKLAATHENAGWILAAVVAAGLIVRALSGESLERGARVGYLLLLGLQLGLTVRSAWLGGQLVWVEATGILAR